jgi:hypothetical protein
LIGRYTTLQARANLNHFHFSSTQSFFGPGIIARIEKTEVGADVFLITDGTGAGRGGKEQKDVLLPLMPGLPARRQD